MHAVVHFGHMPQMIAGKGIYPSNSLIPLNATLRGLLAALTRGVVFSAVHFPVQLCSPVSVNMVALGVAANPQPPPPP